ncbi:MAG: hypothetical protein B0A82_26885 [Alkalinema sp. CACIAM 70d]|nr:MAG: hypothetical protein B0A82_26885 [Alkalinema sp. CACIAM 70d]
MPMDRTLYPRDWDTIARSIKDAANWTCVECGRPCRRPGESDFELCDRIAEHFPQWEDDLAVTIDDEEMGPIDVLKLGRFTLTVAHLNHIPQDCRPENLRALCAPCHCRMDLKAMATKRRLKAERLGQLNLGL